ncbi:hypothetical protein AG0111_0g11852 [Alternaria gaisen]|uniref:Uncharacterized protein n=1 Tax=Alternaria gaisen TaxID=167740 RepID=A0ACB6F5X6_9PLEO|nr:hypothetical protein AG0111_0g11852 [Alternaria gaisen]
MNGQDTNALVPEALEPPISTAGLPTIKALNSSSNGASKFATAFREEISSNHKESFDRLALELKTPRLNKVHHHLWLAGRPTAARPLHRQKLLGRSILVTESPDEHLVWFEDCIFIKPLPDFLLDWDSWNNNLCPDRELYEAACGLLLSYVWLVRHKSDLNAAKEAGLLAKEIEWLDWVKFIDAFLTKIDCGTLRGVNKRYEYGELRLSRLNAIYRLLPPTYSFRNFIRGFQSRSTWYQAFFNRHFKWMLAVFAVLSVILSALQVGLGTTELQGNRAFERFSYGFAVTSLVAVAVALAAVTLCDDELRTTLEAAIKEELLPDEKPTLGFSTNIVPSCYDNENKRIALVNFHDKVPVFLLELVTNPSEIWQIEMGDTDITFDCHFRGMTQLYTPKLDTRVTADIVAITGLDGHAYGSWRGKGNLGHTQCLNQARQMNDNDDVTIAALHRATYGMLLFAIPHKGIAVDGLKKMLGGQEDHSRVGLLEQIKKGSDILAQSLADFKNVVRDRKVVSFYETGQTRQVELNSESSCWDRTGEFQTVVDTESAILQLPDHLEEKIPLNADHSMIVKFNSPDDQGYTSARDKLRKFEKDAPGVVATRFQPTAHSPGNSSIANWISTIPYESHHDFACRNLLAGSGQWLFDSDEFISWNVGDPLTSTVLWLHGIPGSGKTSLVALAIQRERKRLADTKARLAFFYCQRSSAEPQRSKQRELLRSLLRQLAFDINGGLQEPVKILYAKKKKEAELAQHEVQVFTDEEVITLLVKLFKMRNTTIMIDALDEMVRDERPTLYEVFDDISERLRNSDSSDNRHAVLRLLVSSRNDRDIVLKLSSYRNVCIGVANNREDIREFVKRELKKSINGFQLLVDTPKDQQQAVLESIERTLVTKAQGMFRWVSLQIPWICKARNPESVHRQLATIPESLKGSYLRICDLMKSTLLEKDLVLAENAIRLILAAKRNLETQDFLEALQMGSEWERPISANALIEMCQNLVELDTESNIFRFAHLSVREYFEEKEGFRTRDANAFVMNSCIERLQKLSGDHQSETTPFGKYALAYWLQHCEAIGSDGPPEPLRSKVKRFIHNKGKPSRTFELWMSILDENLDDLGLSETQTLGITLASTLVALPSFIASGFGLVWLLKEDFYHQEMGWSSKNKSGDTALLVASTCGQLETVRYLLDQGAAIEGDQAYALHMAAYYGHAEVLSLLLERHVDPNTQINRKNWRTGRTALHYASGWHYASGHSDEERMTNCLLEYGADTELVDDSLETPLFDALRLSTKTPKILIKHGANIHAKSHVGETPLHAATWAAAMHPWLQENVTLLLSMGVDRFAISTYGFTPVGWASISPSLTRLFFQEVPNEAPMELQLGVFSVVQMGSDSSLRYILDRVHDADVNFAHSCAKRPLDFALERMKPGPISILLDRGARPGLYWDLNSPWIQCWRHEGFFSQLSRVISEPVTPPFVSQFSVVSDSRSDEVCVDENSLDLPYIELAVPSNLRTIKGIVFHTISHDQGWSDNAESLGGTYNFSHSWLEVRVKFAEGKTADSFHGQNRHALQHNVHASRDWRWHRNIWDVNDPTRQRWLKNLSPDDTIQVFAKAKYPGWECYVHSVRVEIYGEFVESALSELPLHQSNIQSSGLWSRLGSWVDILSG